ncbi:hypothetical protein EYF80_055078 [Liparis tanakae]|uniref:Uncharacterized protein n=1 Tax=Liparis tanakae TaxID=230148 RepID=A0A4Z2F0M8_9TELE|nr:hypothetical protein EYF80_055078 [Liparis tanakae]
MSRPMAPRLTHLLSNRHGLCVSFVWLYTEEREENTGIRGKDDGLPLQHIFHLKLALTHSVSHALVVH